MAPTETVPERAVAKKMAENPVATTTDTPVAKPLQDIVGILNDGRDEETSSSLEGHEDPDPHIEAMQIGLEASSSSSALSCVMFWPKAMAMEKNDNWMLRIHMLTGARDTPSVSFVVVLSTFSK
jgi:hypothetical protein